MVDGVISASTITQANTVNAQTTVSINQPETSALDLGVRVMPNGTAKISSVASKPFTTQTATAGGGSLFELAGVSVTIADQAAQVLFVSPTEVLIAVPGNLIGGLTDIVVSSRDGFIHHGSANVSLLNPTILGGTGETDNRGVVVDAFSMRSAPFSTTSSWVGLDGRTRLSILATGISSGLSSTDVTNDIWLSNGQLLENLSESVSVSASAADGRVFWLRVEYAGAQGQLRGLDQINVVLVPELAGAGTIQLTVVAGGRVSNPRTIKVN